MPKMCIVKAMPELAGAEGVLADWHPPHLRHLPVALHQTPEEGQDSSLPMSNRAPLGLTLPIFHLSFFARL